MMLKTVSSKLPEFRSLILLLILALPEFLFAGISASTLLGMIEKKVSQIYANENIQLVVEPVNRAKTWEPGPEIDSISVVYSRMEAPRGASVFSFEAHRAGRVIQRLQFAARVRIYREVAFATIPLAEGEPLDAGSLEWRREEITQLRGHPLAREDVQQSWHATHAIRKGTMLLMKQLMPEPLVTKGRTTTLIHRATSFKLHIEATALEHGAKDQSIWFMNPATRQRIKARVIASDLAEIIF